LGLQLLVLLAGGFQLLLGHRQLLAGHLQGHLALPFLQLQLLQERGLPQLLPLQCLLVGGQWLVKRPGAAAGGPGTGL
jgi:hypothetical protein